MTRFSTCPVCHSLSIHPVISAKDFTVSGQFFAIWKCSDCALQFTQDSPDSQEMGKYYASDSYISHTNIQKGWINQLYHRVRNITMEAKRKIISQETGIKKGKVLDVGCGTGLFLHYMREHGWEVTGLEPDAIARQNAIKINRINPLPPEELFKLPPGFQAITLWHVLEHVHQLHEYIERLKELLSANGRLFIAVPNYTSHDALHYKEGWAAYDVPRHLYHFSPASMEKLLLAHGLVIDKMKPMWFDSFYISMLSERYKKSSWAMLKGSVIGLISNIYVLFDKKKCSSILYIIRKA